MSHVPVILWLVFSSLVPGRPLETHPMDQFDTMGECLAYVAQEQREPKTQELFATLSKLGDTATLLCLPAGVRP